ncbi:AHH domain-containing protein [Alkaliphilus crotonatoxidans]
MAGFDQIRVSVPYPIKTIEALEIKWPLNDHATVYMKAILDEGANVNSTINATLEDTIHIYSIQGGEKTLFKGLVTKVKTSNQQGIYQIQIEGTSGSILLDTRKKSRSFQNINMVYPALLKEIIEEYPGHDYINTMGDGTKIKSPVIQYKETDWQLIKRLASQFNSVIVCDIMEKKPRFFFGFPQGKNYRIEEDIPYRADKDLEAFQRAGGYEAGFHDTDFFHYYIQSRSHYQIGDEIWFKKKRMYVTQVEVRLEKGELVYCYQLSRRKGIWQEPIENKKLKGITMEGKVLDVKGEDVKLHLSIDKEQSKETAHWFPFAPPTGNMMYSMPQLGTYASLYLPEAAADRAKVIGCIRKNGATAEKTANPNNRYFGTEHGSQLALTPTEITITGGSPEPLLISLEDETGITLKSHKNLTINALEEIILKTPKQIRLSAQAQIFAGLPNQESGLSIESEYHILGAKTKAEGTDRTTYPPFDDEPQAAEPPVEKKKFNWGKLALNVVAGLAAVAVVAVAAVAVAATLGAGAAVIGGIAIAATVGGTSAVVSHAISDIRQGEVSSVWSYVGSAAREATVSAISAAIFGPMGAGGTLKAKMFLGGVTNAFESCVRQALSGEGINPWVALFDGLVGATVAWAFNAKWAKNLGGKIVNKINNVAPWLKKGANKILNNIDDMAQKIGNASRQFGEEALGGVQKAVKEAGENFAQRANQLINSIDNIKLGGMIPLAAGNVEVPLNSANMMDTPELSKNQQQVAFMEAMEGRNGGTGVVERAGNTRLIPGTDGVVTGGDSTKLGKNMMEAMGEKRSTKWTGYQAQHIIPAEMAEHPVLQKIGMDLDDASNGLFLRVPADDVSTMSRHRGYHSTYNEFVKSQLETIDVTQSVNVLQQKVLDLQTNLKKLQQSGLPLYPNQGATVDLWQRNLDKIKGAVKSF